MKILIQSLLFVVVVALFAITSDRLGKIETLDGMSKSGSNSDQGMGDKEFLSAVIIHHNGAIIMAKEAVSKSERPEIIKFANEVIAMESSNVEEAYVWRRDWFNEVTHIFPDKSDKKISMIKDLGDKDDKFDLRFLDAMIAHHEGAIAMLGEILVPTTKTEIHNMASSGIIALGKDVDTMKEWRKQWYGK